MYINFLWDILSEQFPQLDIIGTLKCFQYSSYVDFGMQNIFTKNAKEICNWSP